jgi:hypothetical protein
MNKLVYVRGKISSVSFTKQTHFPVCGYDDIYMRVLWYDGTLINWNVHLYNWGVRGVSPGQFGASSYFACYNLAVYSYTRAVFKSDIKDMLVHKTVFVLLCFHKILQY